MLDKSCSSKIVCIAGTLEMACYLKIIFSFFLADPSFRDFERGLNHKWIAKNSKSPQEGEAKAVP